MSSTTNRCQHQQIIIPNRHLQMHTNIPAYFKQVLTSTYQCFRLLQTDVHGHQQTVPSWDCWIPDAPLFHCLSCFEVCGDITQSVIHQHNRCAMSEKQYKSQLKSFLGRVSYLFSLHIRTPNFPKINKFCRQFYVWEKKIHLWKVLIGCLYLVTNFLSCDEKIDKYSFLWIILRIIWPTKIKWALCTEQFHGKSPERWWGYQGEWLILTSFLQERLYYYHKAEGS